MSDPGSVALLVGAITVAINAIYLAIRGDHLRKQYPQAGLPSSLSLVWASLLLGTLPLWMGSHLDPSPGSLGDPSWGIGVVGVLSSVVTLGWLSLLIDARSRKLPSELTSLMALEILVSWFITLINVGFRIDGVLAPALGALLWLVPSFIGARTGQIGRGDVRLAPVLGFGLGTMSLMASVLGLLLAYLFAGIAALSLRRHGATIGHRFALGPFLFVGTWSSFAIGCLVPMLAPLTHG